jgi:ferredoxin, 2Fe-2S
MPVPMGEAMVKITYVDPGGGAHCVDVPAGCTLMEGAVDNDIAGILAECGGNCACGTCRIHVPAEWREAIEEPAHLEAAMLEFHELAGTDLRLSCQIRVTPALEGIRVAVARRQT